MSERTTERRYRYAHGGEHKGKVCRMIEKPKPKDTVRVVFEGETEPVRVNRMALRMIHDA